MSVKNEDSLNIVAQAIPSNKDYSETEISKIIKPIVTSDFPAELSDQCSVRRALIINGYLWRGSVPLIFRKVSSSAKSLAVPKQRKYTTFNPKSGEHEGRQYGTGGEACDICPTSYGNRDWCPFLD